MKAPPEGVKCVAAAVCALFGAEESWQSAQKMMADPTKFCQVLVNYDVDNMPMKNVKYI